MFVSLTIVAFLILFGNSNTRGQEAHYIGSESCLSCHGDLHTEGVRQWQQSAHALSMQIANPDGDTATASWLSGDARRQLVAVIGSVRDRQAVVLQDGRITVPDTLTLAATFFPHDAVLAREDSLRAGNLCYGCHATAWSIVEKRYIEPGVGCEACHGPGSEHQRLSGTAGTIINPAALDPDRSRMVCGQCHAVGMDPTGQHPFPVMPGGRHFQPGMDLSAGFIDAQPVGAVTGGEYSTLIASAGVFAEQRCTDCHTVHSPAGQTNLLKDATSALCLRCHGDILSGIIQVDAEQHWGSNEHPCWQCHTYAHIH